MNGEKPIEPAQQGLREPSVANAACRAKRDRDERECKMPCLPRLAHKVPVMQARKPRTFSQLMT